MIRFKDTYSAQGRMLLLGRKFEATIWYSFQYEELDITEVELIGLYENSDSDNDYHSFNLSIKLDFCELDEEQQGQAEELVEFHYNKHQMQEDYE